MKTLLLLPLLLTVTFAAEIKLSWNSNPPEEQVTGYKLYIGTNSRVYDVSVDVSNTTTAIIDITAPRVPYYFAVVAYDVDHLESPFSEEVSYTWKPRPSAPTNLVIRVRLETTNDPTGTNWVVWPQDFLIPVDNTNKFFRSKLEILTPPK